MDNIFTLHQAQIGHKNTLAIVISVMQLHPTSSDGLFSLTSIMLGYSNYYKLAV